MILKLELAAESPGGLVKKIAGLQPEFLFSQFEVVLTGSQVMLFGDHTLKTGALD